MSGTAGNKGKLGARRTVIVLAIVAVLIYTGFLLRGVLGTT